MASNIIGKTFSMLPYGSRYRSSPRMVTTSYGSSYRTDPYGGGGSGITTGSTIPNYYSGGTTVSMSNPAYDSLYPSTSDASSSSSAGPSMLSIPQYLSSDYYGQAKSTLGDYSPVGYNSYVSQVEAGKPTTISAPSEDYYASQRQALMDSLNEQYFGTLGVAQQTASGAAAAGRLGSGVGTAELQTAAMDPFARAVASGYADIGRQQQEAQLAAAQANQQAEESYYNRLASAYQADYANQLQAAMANADQDFQMRQLAAKMASGDVVGLNEAQMKALEQSVAYDDIMRNYADKYLGRQLEYLGITEPENAMYYSDLGNYFFS